MFNFHTENAQSLWSSQWTSSSPVSINDPLVRYKFRTLLKPILDVLPDGSSVCELGCGNGQWLGLCKEIYPNLIYTGIDICPVSQDFCSSYDINYISQDLSIPVSENHSFDFVFSWGLIEHFPIPQIPLLHHLAMSKKFIVLDVPNLFSLATLPLTLRKLRPKYSRILDWQTHGRRFTFSQLDSLVKELLVWYPDWTVECLSANYTILPHSHPFLRSLDYSLPDVLRSLLGHNISITLSKSL